MRMLLVVFVVTLLPAITTPAQPDAASLPYAERGPYPVGTREFTLPDSERPLTVSLWYPALNPDGLEEATTYGPLLTRVNGRALRDAAPDADNGPYPVVVYSHGSGLNCYLSLYITEHLASYGFVVIAADHPGNTILDVLDITQFAENITPSYVWRVQDSLRLIAFVEALAADDEALAGVIDTERMIAAGYSFGGNTAVTLAGGQWDFSALNGWCAENAGSALDAYPDVPVYPTDGFTAELTYGACFLRDEAEALAALRGLDSVPDGLWPAMADPRIDALVAFAPWNMQIFGKAGISPVEIPALVIVGTNDGVAFPERDALPLVDWLSSVRKSLVMLEGADHYVFVDECPQFLSATGQSWICTDDVWAMAEAHALITHMTTAFLLAEFYDDVAAAAALLPDAVNFPDVAYTTNRAGR